MGYYLDIGNTGLQPLASNKGMDDLNKWIETLPLYSFGELIHLSEWGWCQHLAELESQLSAAVKDHRSPKDDVMTTANGMLEAIKDRDKESLTCYISDGFTEDDGKDDEPINEEKSKSVETAPRTTTLPQGESIAHALIEVFNEQRLAVVKSIHSRKSKDESDAAAADLPDKFIPLENWTPAMANNVRPLIELIAHEGGSSIVKRVGASPEVQHVVDRNIPEAARKLTLKFCEATHATTSMQLDDALALLRKEIAEGLQVGDRRQELTKRVNAVFDQATKSRADVIAKTEASRAIHSGELIGAKASGVVSKKKWLCSSDCCDICEGIADEFPDGIDLDKDFGVTDYGPVECPPLHPNCQCSQTMILITPKATT